MTLNAVGDVTLTGRDATIPIFHADTLSVWMLIYVKLKESENYNFILPFLRFVSDAKRCLKKILTAKIHVHIKWHTFKTMGKT